MTLHRKLKKQQQQIWNLQNSENNERSSSKFICLQKNPQPCFFSVGAVEDQVMQASSLVVNGFVLGGIVAGTLGCIFAPQNTRKVVTEKIAQLNLDIDEISAQLHANDAPNEATVNI
ncbi:hypothetical protein ACOSQ4_022771 [Xanthoceras sorbifolium]